MRIDLKKLDKDQLVELLRKLNMNMAGCNQGGYKYVKAQRKYQTLKKEFERRRLDTIDEAPEVIRRDRNNQFGIINREYYQTLNPIDQEIYITWKWVEL